jgi:hypothetical protein
LLSHDASLANEALTGLLQGLDGIHGHCLPLSAKASIQEARPGILHSDGSLSTAVLKPTPRRSGFPPRSGLTFSVSNLQFHRSSQPAAVTLSLSRIAAAKEKRPDKGRFGYLGPAAP